MLAQIDVLQVEILGDPVVELDGLGVCQASAAAGVAISKPLAGSGVGTCTRTGALAVSKPLAGSGVGTCTRTGALFVRKLLGAGVNGYATTAFSGGIWHVDADSFGVNNVVYVRGLRDVVVVLPDLHPVKVDKGQLGVAVDDISLVEV